MGLMFEVESKENIRNPLGNLHTLPQFTERHANIDMVLLKKGSGNM